MTNVTLKENAAEAERLAVTKEPFSAVALGIASLLGAGTAAVNAVAGGAGDGSETGDIQEPINDLARQLAEFIMNEKERNIDAQNLYDRALAGRRANQPLIDRVREVSNELVQSNPALAREFLTRNNLKESAGGRPQGGNAAPSYNLVSTRPGSALSTKQADGKPKPWYAQVGTFALWAGLLVGLPVLVFFGVTRLLAYRGSAARVSGGGGGGFAVSAKRGGKRRPKSPGRAVAMRSASSSRSGKYDFQKPMKEGPFAGRTWQSLSVAQKRQHRAWKGKQKGR